MMLIGANKKNYLLGANVLIHSIKKHNKDLNVDFICISDEDI